MIFVGNQERGYFSEEFAGKNGLDFAYVGTFPHIADQTNDILRHGKQDYTIFDVHTYIDEADEIADQINKVIESEVRVTVPGHIQRGGEPCPYDRVLSTRIGAGAAEAILDEEYGIMVGIINGKIKRIPLAECAGKLKMVSPKDQIVKAAKQIGISFGD